MKTLMNGTALAAIASVAIAAPSFADVDALATVDLDKDFTITLDISKRKDIDIEVDAAGDLAGAAVASAFVNATIDNNRSSYAGDESESEFAGDANDMDWEKSAIVIDSILSNTGITQVNQDAGNNANQGNLVSAGLTFGEESSITQAEAYADQRVSNNDTYHREGAENLNGLVGDDDSINPDNLVDPADLAAEINNSISANTGVTMANQNTGNFNNQHNVLTAAVGEAAFVALSDAGLGQEISGNEYFDVNTVKTNVITNSVNGNTGVTAVNQASGHMNNQATIVSVASLASAVGLGG